jgi:hypothetical protein
MAHNEKLALLAEIAAEIARGDLEKFADLERRAKLAGGLAFLMPQAE